MGCSCCTPGEADSGRIEVRVLVIALVASLTRESCLYCRHYIQISQLIKYQTYTPTLKLLTRASLTASMKLSLGNCNICLASSVGKDHTRELCSSFSYNYNKNCLLFLLFIKLVLRTKNILVICDY